MTVSRTRLALLSVLALVVLASGCVNGQTKLVDEAELEYDEVEVALDKLENGDEDADFVVRRIEKMNQSLKKIEEEKLEGENLERYNNLRAAQKAITNITYARDKLKNIEEQYETFGSYLDTERFDDAEEEIQSIEENLEEVESHQQNAETQLEEAEIRQNSVKYQDLSSDVEEIKNSIDENQVYIQGLKNYVNGSQLRIKGEEQDLAEEWSKAEQSFRDARESFQNAEHKFTEVEEKEGDLKPVAIKLGCSANRSSRRMNHLISAMQASEQQDEEAARKAFEKRDQVSRCQ